MKKIAIVGRGTVGCMAVAHFLKWTDWQIDWIYDPLILPAVVGEGTTLTFPRSLSENLSLDNGNMFALKATPKLGISKRNWGDGKEFNHSFAMGQSGIHFDAVVFQDYIFNNLCNNPRLKLIEKNIEVSDIDADHVMVCSGTPNSFEHEYKLVENIPVNACFVSQCPWESPTFNHTLTYAMSWGWVFGIPLQHRCAIGYVYNDKFASEAQVKNEVQDVLNELNLVPAIQRSIKFNNYYRANNFSNRVIYNGNASFFLEPLEATSTHFAQMINRMAIDVFKHNMDYNHYGNQRYLAEINDIESMICLHYFAGSVFKNDFWSYAEGLADKKITAVISTSNPFSNMVKTAINATHVAFGEGSDDVGTWPLRSFKININGLGVENKLKHLIHS